jgi:hypothetical protein
MTATGATLKPLPLWRWCSFSGSVISFMASLAFMANGVSRAHQTTDYLEQARIAIPFICWGSLCALLSLCLSGFGRGMGRWAALICSAFLLAWWYGIAISIY